MHPSCKKGNNPEAWNKLLELLDDKLQLGLLDHLKRVASYHIEDKTLTIQPETQKDHDYLNKNSVAQQLVVFAGEACKCDKVLLNTPTP
jgi:hypothetical protein